jgi:integrase
VKKELAVWRQVLNHASAREKYWGDAKCAIPNIKTRYQPRTAYLTLEEAEAVWLELRRRNPARAAHFAWFLGTGARLAEAQRAREEHVHEDEIDIPGTKTVKAAATIPITAITKPWVERALRGAPRPKDGLLFAPWSSLTRDVKSACVAARTRTVSPNDLRRTMITWHHQRGVPPHLLAELARHASTEMVQRVYAQKSSRATAEVLDKYVALAKVVLPGTRRQPKKGRAA